MEIVAAHLRTHFVAVSSRRNASGDFEPIRGYLFQPCRPLISEAGKPRRRTSSYPAVVDAIRQVEKVA